MNLSRLADSLFVGAGVVPVTLTLGGYPGQAIMLLVPLLFIGCLCGLAELMDDEESSDK
jgi:hypothetical protein